MIEDENITVSYMSRRRSFGLSKHGELETVQLRATCERLFAGEVFR